VTSGAVGLGRQRLRYRQMINSRLRKVATFNHFLPLIVIKKGDGNHLAYVRCCFVLCGESLFLFLWVCSFADLQKPQSELDGKACAGVGQSSLMAYYETMFDQVRSFSFYMVLFFLDSCVNFQILMALFSF